MYLLVFPRFHGSQLVLNNMETTGKLLRSGSRLLTD